MSDPRLFWAAQLSVPTHLLDKLSSTHWRNVSIERSHVIELTPNTNQFLSIRLVSVLYLSN